MRLFYIAFTALLSPLHRRWILKHFRSISVEDGVIWWPITHVFRQLCSQIKVR